MELKNKYIHTYIYFNVRRNVKDTAKCKIREMDTSMNSKEINIGEE